MASPRVVVIGAGPGGLSAAMLLAARGFEVDVFERRPDVGGRTGRLDLGPYRFDLGSTMLMMPFVAEELFALSGTALTHEVKLARLDPMYRLDFGTRAIDMSAEHERMKAELARFAPGSEQGLDRFLACERSRFEHLYPVLQRSWAGLAGLASREVVAALPHIGLGKSLHATAADYFQDPALQLAFSFQSAYLGMSPWECPGGFAMVPYVEHAYGLYHIEGGVNQLCRAMARVATRLGARIHTGTRVRHLDVSRDRCRGVLLADGSEVAADQVIINADATQAVLELLDEDVSRRFTREHVGNMRESCSAFMIYLGLDTRPPLGHHTFLFAKDYRAEMERIFHSGSLSDDLSLYVCNPVVSDPSVAPPGHGALYLLALVPNTRAAIDWREEASRMRQRVFSVFVRRTGYDLAQHARVETTISPIDWQERFGVSHGAVFGPAHSIDQLLTLRLPNHLPHPSNVFLAGGGTSPGSGLPTVLESGRIAARLACEAEGRSFPPSRPLPSASESSSFGSVLSELAS